MTVFKNRSFCYPKDPENPEQNQDSFQVSDSLGLAVVADGVSSAIFSAAWSNILTKHVLQDRPDPANQTDFAQWLSNLREEWEQSIDTTNLSWFQRPKMASGAFSTLIWVQVREIAPPRTGSNLWNRLQNPDAGRRCFHIKGHCIGDSCLFHVRPGRTDSESFSGSDLYRVLPLTKSSEFNMPPIVIGSKDLGRDDQIQFQQIDFLAQEGDLVILATDAVSQWLLRCYETQAFPCWDLFWNLTPETWGQELDALRSAGEIRYDDSTLVLLQLGNSNTFLNQPVVVPGMKAEVPPVTVPEPETTSAPAADFVPETTSASAADFAPETTSASAADFAPETASVPAASSAHESVEAPDADSIPEPETETVAVFAADSEPEAQFESPSQMTDEPISQMEFEAVSEMTIEPATVSLGDSSLISEMIAEPSGGFEETTEPFQTAEPVKTAQTLSSPPHKPTPPKKPISNPGSTPQPGGFQYRMASSSSARKFGPAPASRPQPSVPKSQGHPQTRDANKPAVHQPPEQTPEENGTLAENWKQIKESSSQIAGIIGGQISEGMSRLGSNLNEGVSHLSESAKPKIQGLTQRLVGIFSRKKTEQTETAEEPEEKPEENKTPARVIDPNRRRFYNPPPRE